MKKKFLFSFTISLVLFSIMYMGIYEMKASTSFYESIDNEQISEELNEEFDEEIRFLLCGVDSDDVNKENTLTDTIMLISVDFDMGGISILSVPRDTRVSINGRTQKINAAHALGGMPLTISTVSNLLEVKVDHFVKVDYQVVMDLVDIIGGVEIDVPRRMKYDDTHKGKEFHVDLYPGVQTLDKNQAMQFVRWRTNNDGTGYREGDVGRIDTQQYFLTELIKQTLGSDKLFRKLPSIAMTYFKNVETNLPLDIILKGVKVANNLDTTNIITEVLPGVGKYVGDTSYFIHHEQETKDLVDALYNN